MFALPGFETFDVLKQHRIAALARLLHLSRDTGNFPILVHLLRDALELSMRSKCISKSRKNSKYESLESCSCIASPHVLLSCRHHLISNSCATERNVSLRLLPDVEPPKLHLAQNKQKMHAL